MMGSSQVDAAGAARNRSSTPPFSGGEVRLIDRSTPRPRVLWADDDPGVNRFGERLLIRSGYDVTIAPDVQAAMSASSKGTHGAMVLDQRLDGGEDLAVLRRMRGQGFAMPVVVLTGFGTAASAIEALSLGVVDYQVKPAIGLRLVAALRIALRIGTCRPGMRPPQLTVHPDVSLALLSAFLNFEHADADQLRTQLGWAVADALSFVELVASVEALRLLLEDPPLPNEAVRPQIRGWLARSLGLTPEMLSQEVQAFVRLITADAHRVRYLRNDALAREVGVPLGDISRLVHRELGIGPDRCRLIAYLQPALRELAHSAEQVAQVGYRLGQNLPSGFDNVFRKLWGVPPTAYRELLTGLRRADPA